jgi:tetrahydromethanopterin S-methyltransferase subunit C
MAHLNGVMARPIIGRMVDDWEAPAAVWGAHAHPHVAADGICTQLPEMAIVSGATCLKRRTSSCAPGMDL